MKKYEGLSYNDLLSSYSLDRNDDNNGHIFMLHKAEYGSPMVVIEEISSEIGRTIDVCKEHDNIL